MIILEIKTHDGDIYEEEVEQYNPQELNEQINDESTLTLVIGSRILSRLKIAEVSVKSVDISEDSVYN